MKTFKIHMVLFAETFEGFSTVCGINDGCSAEFYDSATLVDFGDVAKTSCKNCLRRFKKLEAKENELQSTAQ